MERSDKKPILILITNPFAMLNIIHSGLMCELDKMYRISVISDLLTEADINRLNKHFQVKMRLLETPVPPISRLVKWLRSLQILLFGHFFDLDTVRIKLMGQSVLLFQLFRLSGNSVALRFLSGSLLQLTRKWLIHLTTRPDRYAGLARQAFIGIISSSPLDIRENEIVNSLQTSGIRCISIIISWDNLTSKGVINMKSDLVLVWSRAMAQEYNRFYSLFRDRAVVRVTGIPRFDIYFQKPRNEAFCDFRNQLDISFKTRVILFSTGAVKHHSSQNYIIQDLLEYADAKPDTIILVRCHPGDDPKRYRPFHGFKKLFFFQSFGDCANGEIPPIDFPDTLQMHLETCHVCVQVASTMFLDAAACNKPSISIAYDTHNNKPYAESVKRFYDYSHQLSLRTLSEDHIVYDRWSLFRKLDEILETAGTEKDLRTALKPLMHHCTADSVCLTAQYIQEWLD